MPPTFQLRIQEIEQGEYWVDLQEMYGIVLVSGKVRRFEIGDFIKKGIDTAYKVVPDQVVEIILSSATQK